MHDESRWIPAFAGMTVVGAEIGWFVCLHVGMRMARPGGASPCSVILTKVRIQRRSTAVDMRRKPLDPTFAGMTALSGFLNDQTKHPHYPHC
ncbi:hypothetical protein [Herbaspirillum robiniae]|uniref:hypothetical protein n=1 Tax=Herbaspirillum robiniae TaxID=2014887 RepID=UPI00101AD543|nr:hypothetical protein [Herbaspirillum robiniae]